MVGPGMLSIINLPWQQDVSQVTQAGTQQQMEMAGQSVLAVNAAYHLVSDVPVTVYQFNSLSYQNVNMSQCDPTNDLLLLVYERLVAALAEHGTDRKLHGAFGADAGLGIPGRARPADTVRVGRLIRGDRSDGREHPRDGDDHGRSACRKWSQREQPVHHDYKNPVSRGRARAIVCRCHDFDGVCDPSVIGE